MVKQICRYREEEILYSKLDPLEDVICWIEGLTSINYVKDLLTVKHSPTPNPTIRQRSESISKLVTLACSYLKQANSGPKEVSFLPLYYACLNLLKTYIVAGPHANELNQNRLHGASYNPNRDFRSLDDDTIDLHPRGAIPLFYRTVVGQSISCRLTLRMRDILPYIADIQAEYTRVSKIKSRMLPFEVNVVKKGENQRIEAIYPGEDKVTFQKVKVGSLQGFKGLRRESKGGTKLVSKWYSQSDTALMMACIRPAMLYAIRVSMSERTRIFVPSSTHNLFLPEELPIICALYHIASMIRYNPDGFMKLMNSKYWPVLLVLRRHGLYRFLLLFWSFINQCDTHILPA